MKRRRHLSPTQIDDDERMTAPYQTPEAPSELKGWTKDEMYDLNNALKLHSYNIPSIKTFLPNKTEEQIQAAINYFHDDLLKKTSTSRRQTRKLKPWPQVPLSKWADRMTELYNYTQLRTECATALRIIADFEDFPHPSVCHDIDFQQAYHHIADAMEGKPLTEDPCEGSVYNHCIMESSELGKNYIPKNELDEILSATSHSECNINKPLPTTDRDLRALRHIAAQTNYNPLRIPEKYILYSKRNK